MVFIRISEACFCSLACYKEQAYHKGQISSVENQGEMRCVYCRGNMEDREHLFFQCSLTGRIWREAMRCCLIDNPEVDGVHCWIGV